MSHSHTLMECDAMNASLPHGSLLRYEDNPLFANSSEQISMELEILEAGSRAGHDVSGSNRIGYHNYRSTAKRSANPALLNPRQFYLHHPASYRHTSRRVWDPIYVPQAGTLGPRLPGYFPSGYTTSLAKSFNNLSTTTVRPCDIWPQHILSEAEDVDIDDIFEAQEAASDIDMDSDDSTIAASPHGSCASGSDGSASTTDVEDSSDDAEYVPTSRKTSPCSSRTLKSPRTRGIVSDRSPSPGSPCETESPCSQAAPRNTRCQTSARGKRNATPLRKTNTRPGKPKTEGHLRCLIIGCKNQKLMDERSRDRHMDSHFINRYFCAVCGQGFTTDYSYSRHKGNQKPCAGAKCIIRHAAPYWRTCVSDVLQRPDDPRDPLVKFFDKPDADRSCECGHRPLSQAEKNARRREPRNAQ